MRGVSTNKHTRVRGVKVKLCPQRRRRQRSVHNRHRNRRCDSCPGNDDGDDDGDDSRQCPHQKESVISTPYSAGPLSRSAHLPPAPVVAVLAMSRLWTWLAVVALLLPLASAATPQRVNATDQQAVLALYNATTNASYTWSVVPNGYCNAFFACDTSSNLV